MAKAKLQVPNLSARGRIGAKDGLSVKRQAAAKFAAEPKGGGARILGYSPDGVAILKPSGRSTHFEAGELREIIRRIKAARRAKA